MDIASLPSFYLSAPTSPSGRTPETIHFYSTRSSPVQQLVSTGSSPVPQWSSTNDDEFEFDYRLPARSNSFSTVSFADELFCNGQVLPLKPPPRLQTSVPTSPRSFSSRVKNPFAHRSTWNDGFDPFMIALEKVSEEPEGRASVHRRSLSYSPVRVNCTVGWDHGQEKEPTVIAMMERKGSMYSKWARSQTMVKKSPTARTVIKRLWLGHSEPKQSEPEPASSIIPVSQQAKTVAR